MASFETWDGIEIAYREWGEAGEGLPPVVLHHGFVADAESNWVATGVVEALTGAGRRVVAPDARGHGASEKPHDPASYGEDRMARDLAELVDLLGEPRVDRRSVSNEAIVAALEVGDPAEIEDPGALPFRQLADAVGADRVALAAQARSVYRGEIALDRISAPTLLLAGEDDPLALRPETLVEAIPDAELRMVRGNHVGALGDPTFKTSIVDFLAA